MSKQSEFQQELENLINRFSRESNSGTPDFILAKYLISCLHAFDEAVVDRDKWYRADEDNKVVPMFQNIKGEVSEKSALIPVME